MVLLTRRNELADRYQEALSDWPQWTLPERPIMIICILGIFIHRLINEDIARMDRDEFMQAMKEKNIGTGCIIALCICILIIAKYLVLSRVIFRMRKMCVNALSVCRYFQA